MTIIAMSFAIVGYGNRKAWAITQVIVVIGYNALKILFSSLSITVFNLDRSESPEFFTPLFVFLFFPLFAWVGAWVFRQLRKYLKTRSHS